MRRSAATARLITLTRAALATPARFPDQYCWYVLVCTLDLMLTATILARFGGIEVNGLAHRIIELGGLPGLIVFKFATVITVLAIDETIARTREPTARRLASWAVALSAIPVAVALLQIAGAVAAGRLPA